MIFERMQVEYWATESFGFFFYILNSDSIDHYYTYAISYLTKIEAKEFIF